MKKLLLSSLVYAVGALFLLSCQPSNAVEMMNAHGQKMEMEFKLEDPGTEIVPDYEKYGTFEGLGTNQYRYKMTDRKGLSAAVGEGVYPNNSVYKDPSYKMLLKKGKLGGSHWDYVNIDDQMLAFYKWATSHDTAAVQQFYTGLALEKAGLLTQALKAYHAVMVHYPTQTGVTYFKTPLYMSKLAMDRIEFITAKHPELGIKLEGARIIVNNGFDLDAYNDTYAINPGKLIKVDPSTLKLKQQDLSKLAIVKELGGVNTKLVQYENGHWQLLVDSKPYMVKGIAYAPTQIGRTPHKDGYDPNNGWMSSDVNQNGLIDGPYDTWVDKNKNNIQDTDEPVVGDFQLLKEMGVNTMRLYHHAASKQILRELYEKYGIRVIMGDLLGMYAAGSGADWYQGTDYTNPEHLENMRNSVRKMVEEFKDEPYVLMWMLGNESNYGYPGNPDPKSFDAGMGCKAKLQPNEHYQFVNEIAGMIKQLDPTRPVGYSNGEVITIDILAKSSHNIDIFGCNVYRGESGFGRSFWEDVKTVLDKPVLFTEYGCPSYMQGKDAETAEQKQLDYHKGNWEDILNNQAGYGYGSAIGGVVFEFVDEWWKTGLPPKFVAEEHDTVGDFRAAFPDGWMHEEWLGVVSQADGSASPFMRQLRKTYSYYKEVWN